MGQGDKRRMDFDRSNEYLRDLKGAYDELGVKFCLFFGTLVGAVRDEDFVEWDNDVDVAVMGEDCTLEMIENLKKILAPKGYYFAVGNRQDNHVFNFYIAKKEFKEKVDTYGLPIISGQRWYLNWINRSDMPAGFYCVPFPLKYFDDMQEIEFKGEKYHAPTPPEEFLEYLWGDWWVGHGGQVGNIKSTYLGVKPL